MYGGFKDLDEGGRNEGDVYERILGASTLPTNTRSWESVVPEFVHREDSPGFIKDGIHNGDVLRCDISWVENFQQIYLQPKEQLARLEEFEKSLRSFCENASTMIKRKSKPLRKDLIVGRYFAAFVKRIPAEYPKWYRVQLAKLVPTKNDKMKVMVWLIDYGNISAVDEVDMRFLPRVFLVHFKALAIPCKLKVRNNWGPEIGERISIESKEIGTVMRQYLDDFWEQVTVKFHNTFIEPTTNLTSWSVSAVMVHSVKNKLLTPSEMTLGDFMVHKYFKEGVRPRTEKYVDMREIRQTDWDQEQEVPAGCRELSDNTKYKKWTTYESSLRLNKNELNDSQTKFHCGTSVQRDMALNQLYTVFMQPYYNGLEKDSSEVDGGMKKLRLNGDFLNISNSLLRDNLMNQCGIELFIGRKASSQITENDTKAANARNATNSKEEKVFKIGEKPADSNENDTKLDTKILDDSDTTSESDDSDGGPDFDNSEHETTSDSDSDYLPDDKILDKGTNKVPDFVDDEYDVDGYSPDESDDW